MCLVHCFRALVDEWEEVNELLCILESQEWKISWGEWEGGGSRQRVHGLVAVGHVPFWVTVEVVKGLTLLSQGV